MIGIIGAGNMGRAIADRIDGCLVYDRKENEHTNAGKVEVAACDYVILAIKPQDLTMLELKTDAVVVSILAGVKLDRLEALGFNRIVRVMPNICTLKGKSATCFSSRGISEDEKIQVTRLLERFGTCHEVEEVLLDAVTAVSGSGPAFAAFIMREFVAAGVEQGLDEKLSQALVRQTFLGTLSMLEEMGEDELISRVSSRGGTTEAGMLNLTDAQGIIHATVKAAAQRSREIGK